MATMSHANDKGRSQAEGWQGPSLRGCAKRWMTRSDGKKGAASLW